MATGLRDLHRFFNREWGGCRIDTLLDRGAFGAVFRARQLSLDRDVAVKIQTLEGEAAADPGLVEKMTAEARALGRFQHRNIVKVFNAGCVDGVFFLVMELLEGETLLARLERETPLNPRDAVNVALEVATGLSAAHLQGIVHRDLKPSNVFLVREGRPKLIDFGLADAFAGIEREREKETRGTPTFMAPEQWRNEAADGRTDLYALGLLLYRMLSGNNLWRSHDVPRLREMHLSAPVPEMTELRALVPDGVIRLVRKLIQKNPADRPDDARHVVEFLQRLRHQHAELAPDPGTQTTRVCGVCATPNPLTADACTRCGKPLNPAGETEKPAAPAIRIRKKGEPPLKRARHRGSGPRPRRRR